MHHIKLHLKVQMVGHVRMPMMICPLSVTGMIMYEVALASEDDGGATLELYAEALRFQLAILSSYICSFAVSY